MAESVIVGRIGPPHGVRGDVHVEPRTDEPDRRFVIGARLATREPGGAPGPTLTITDVRWHSGRLLVRFEEALDRNAVEALRGLVLEVDIDPTETPADPDEFYDHQLVGLVVDDVAGRTIGTVLGVRHDGAQDLLRLDVAGREVLFPFVAALVPIVDIDGGRIVIDDRPGLLREEW